jgi:hypothetical protein
MVVLLILIAIVTLGNNMYRFYDIYSNFGLEIYGTN